MHSEEKDLLRLYGKSRSNVSDAMQTCRVRTGHCSWGCDRCRILIESA